MNGVATLSGSAALALLVLAAGETAAQSLEDFHLGSWDGSLELDYGQGSERAESNRGLPNNTARRRALEEITIGNHGFFFINPDLASGDLILTLGLTQLRTSTDGVGSSDQSKILGFAFDSNFLSQLPYNASIYANRNQSFQTLPFEHIDLTFENAGATCRLREDSPLRDWGFPYFSANLNAEHQHVNETTTNVFGQSFQHNESQNAVNFDAHKGFETADLDLIYQFLNVNNPTQPQLDFQSQTARASYSVDFGPTLNYRSDSNLFYYSRTGFDHQTFLSADEGLRLDHQENLFTRYRYLWTRNETTTGTLTTQNGVFEASYQPYRNLSASGLLTGTHSDLNTGTRDAYTGTLLAQYQHDVPGNGNFFLNITEQYQLNENRLSASTINVTDEAHAAPSPLGAGAGFQLNQPFVVASSIVVVDTRGGTRLPTVLNVDYEVIQQGNLTRIVPLATSALIRAGDPLLVTYANGLDASIRYSITTHSANVGLNFPWISMSLGHEQAKDTLLSGQDLGFLQNLRRDTAQLSLRGTWQTFDAQGIASYIRYNSTFLDYTQQQYQALANYRPTNSLTVTLTANRTLTDLTLPLEKTDASSTQLSLDWYPRLPGWSNWSTTAAIGRSVFRDTLQPTETITTALLTQRMTYGKLDLSATFAGGERRRGDFSQRSWAFELTAVRHF